MRGPRINSNIGGIWVLGLSGMLVAGGLIKWWAISGATERINDRDNSKI